MFFFELFHFKNIRGAVTITELLIIFNKIGLMTCILGDVRSGRCSVFQGVGTSLQGALPVCRSLTFPKQKRFQINPPTDLLSNFHINNKTTLVFCLRVRTTCGFWLPRYDHHLLNPQSLRQEGKWGVRC